MKWNQEFADDYSCPYCGGENWEHCEQFCPEMKAYVCRCPDCEREFLRCYQEEGLKPWDNDYGDDPYHDDE
jgi:hypothetical protein